MKIIRTPIEWKSEPDGNWLDSIDNIETAKISVDEMESSSRTGAVTFTQKGGGDPKTVTVEQKRVTTFYYVLQTNVRTETGPIFDIGGEHITATSHNGFAVKISRPNDAAPKKVTATPETDIAKLRVAPPTLVFEADGGKAGRRVFYLDDWYKTGSTPEATLTRQTVSGHPTGFINSASTVIDTVSAVSATVDWIYADTQGNISASTNTGSVRTATITYYCGNKTATVDVAQKGKPEPTTVRYFGVKTMSTFANGKSVAFKINGGENIEKVFNYDSGGFYIAYITASSNSNVTVSCNISDYWIEVNPSELEFPYSGATKGVIVNATKKYLSADDQSLIGYDSLTLGGLYQIDSGAETCGYSVIVTGEGFCVDSIQSYTTLITASENETGASRKGGATFSIAEASDKQTTVSFTQENTPLFSFKSAVTGSPSGGTVTIYDTNGSIQPEKIVTTLTYTQNEGVYSVDWSGHVKSSNITYVVNGFERSGAISASTSSVTFGNIEMKKNSNNHYYISGTETGVTVSALGVSYQYQCEIDGKPSSYTTSGVIPANSEVVLNATATTTNEFYTSAYYDRTDRNHWEYVVNSGDSWTASATSIDVKYLPLRRPSTEKTLELTYYLGNGDDGFKIYSAQTTFHVPANADSGINFDNFALSSSTAFWDDYERNNNKIPTGSNAYKFAFIPSARLGKEDLSSYDNIHRANLCYRPPGPNQGGWMLLHPYSVEETSGYCEISIIDHCNRPQKYIAKIYAISYGNPQPLSGNDDVWTLGPLLYDNVEVDGFKFLSSDTRVNVVQTKSNQYPYYCPIQNLSASSAYFGVYNERGTVSSATSGTITGGGKQWFVRGYAQGGLNGTVRGNNSFFANIGPMIGRNVNFQYSEDNHCPDSNDSSTRHYSPFAMAYSVTGNLNTNLLGAVNLKMIYYGKYGQGTDVPPTGATYHVPASSYVVSPKTPEDTSSVVYDTDTNSYIIYDINNVVVVDRHNNSVVVDVSELEQFITPTSDEIIDQVNP